MLLKKIEDVVLIFDNEDEAITRFKEIKSLKNCTDQKLCKDFSFEFNMWTYVISYKRTIY